jgi:hypothetical protein
MYNLRSVFKRKKVRKIAANRFCFKCSLKDREKQAFTNMKIRDNRLRSYLKDELSLTMDGLEYLSDMEYCIDKGLYFFKSSNGVNVLKCAFCNFCWEGCYRRCAVTQHEIMKTVNFTCAFLQGKELDLPEYKDWVPPNFENIALDLGPPPDGIERTCIHDRHIVTEHSLFSTVKDRIIKMYTMFM